MTHISPCYCALTFFGPDQALRLTFSFSVTYGTPSIEISAHGRAHRTACGPVYYARRHSHENHHLCAVGPLRACRYRGSCERLRSLERRRGPPVAAVIAALGPQACPPAGHTSSHRGQFHLTDFFARRSSSSRTIRSLSLGSPTSSSSIRSPCAPIREQNARS